MTNTELIKACEDWANNHTGENFLLTYSSVVELLTILKEQEAVKPYIDIDEAKCPICKVKLTRQEPLGDDVLFEDFFDYCPHCGRKVKWECV